jgi:hypothetical protein
MNTLFKCLMVIEVPDRHFNERCKQCIYRMSANLTFLLNASVNLTRYKYAVNNVSLKYLTVISITVSHFNRVFMRPWWCKGSFSCP